MNTIIIYHMKWSTYNGTSIGRGPLAGPVVVAACYVKKGIFIPGDIIIFMILYFCLIDHDLLSYFVLLCFE